MSCNQQISAFDYFLTCRICGTSCLKSQWESGNRVQKRVQFSHQQLLSFLINLWALARKMWLVQAHLKSKPNLPQDSCYAIPNLQKSGWTWFLYLGHRILAAYSFDKIYTVNPSLFNWITNLDIHNYWIYVR